MFDACNDAELLSYRLLGWSLRVFQGRARSLAWLGLAWLGFAVSIQLGHLVTDCFLVAFFALTRVNG